MFECPLTPTEITDVINKAPSSYGQVSALNLFTFKGIVGTRFGIEEMDEDQCNGIVPTAPFCCDYDNAANTTPGRKWRMIEVPHTPLFDTVRACDIAGERAYGLTGTDFEYLQVVEEVARRQRQMRQKLDLTMEYRQLGALKGVIYDANGKVILDLFRHFGVNQKVFKFEFADPNFDVLEQLRKIGRYLKRTALNVNFSQVMFFVDDIFFDALVKHQSVAEIWKHCCELGQRVMVDASVSTSGDMPAFSWGGMTFVEYYNQGCTSPDMTDPDQARAPISFLDAGTGIGFPRNVGGQSMYEMVAAPRMNIDEVNRRADKLFYANIRVNEKRDALKLDLETNSLPIVKQPALLVKVVAEI